MNFHHDIRYNPLQLETAKFISEDSNLVILAPTSAGKTIVGEQFIFSSLEAGKKAIYLSPLKALTEEKKRAWEKLPYSMLVCTGDYGQATSFAAQLVLMTTEALDSKTRGAKDWLKKVGCIVVDEAHLLGLTGRGDALEVGLIRFSQINPQARLILMSATIPNAQELANWLHRLNGKPSCVVESDYRPVEQEHFFIPCGGQEWAVNQKVAEMVKYCKQIYPGQQILVFVHSVGKGQSISRELMCPFHYSKLSKDKKFALEEAFTQKKVSTLVATSTLAYGVNLPADIVIIAGANRGPDRVDSWDLKQMAGRAGRYGLSDRGYVYYVMKETYIEDVQDELLNIHPVASVIADRLYFHLCSFIYREHMQLKEIDEFLFKAFQWPVDIMPHLNTLRDLEIIYERTDGKLDVSSVGRAAALMYLNPIDLYTLRNNLISQPNTPREIAIAFSNLPCYDIPCHVADDVKNYLVDLGVGMKTLHASCLNQWLSGRELGVTASIIVPRLTSDIPRWLSGLTIAGMNKDYIKSLEVRFAYGVTENMTELLAIPGLGRKRAMELSAHRIYNLKEALAKKEVTQRIVGKTVMERISDKVLKPNRVVLRF